MVFVTLPRKSKTEINKLLNPNTKYVDDKPVLKLQPMPL